MHMASKGEARPPVAITGVGIVSALGVGAEEWRAAAAEGEPALETLSGGETGGKAWRAAPVRNYDVAPLLDSRKAYLDRHTALLLGAMSLALRQSGWTRETLPRERAGLMVGSAWGGFGTMATFFHDVLAKGPKFAKPILFPHAYANTAAAMAAIEWGIQGPHEHYAEDGLASGHALVAALDSLRSGQAELVFAGGCEGLSPAVFRALEAQGWTPETRVPGEGAAMLALETRASASARNVPVLAWLAGAGLSGTDAATACRLALEDAGIPADAIGAAIASRLDAPGGPAATVRALCGDVPVFCPSSLQGDCLGAAMALDVAAGVSLFAMGSMPPAAGATPRAIRPDRPVLVVGTGENGAAAMVLTPSCP